MSKTAPDEAWLFDPRYRVRGDLIEGSAEEAWLCDPRYRVRGELIEEGSDER